LKPIPDLFGHDISREPGVQCLAQALLSVQSKAANELWTAEEFAKLALHLHNGNEPRRFVMEIRTENGKQYVRSKTVGISKAIPLGVGLDCGACQEEAARPEVGAGAATPPTAEIGGTVQ
jgi:hypothetical protein